MKNPVVIIGIGEIGGVFARGLLRLGHPVYPVTRGTNLAQAANEFPSPELVLITVTEGDLYGVMEEIPPPWQNRLGFVQNELLPRDWLAHGFEHPTVVPVWFEKKPGHEARPLIPSPIHGPSGKLLHDALATLELPSRIVSDDIDFEHELVLKNLYILTTNIIGLELAEGASVHTLWHEHGELVHEVTDEILAIQAYLTGREHDRKRLMDGLHTAIKADPQHRCKGRSANDRLERTLQFANLAHLKVPRLRAIHSRHGPGLRK